MTTILAAELANRLARAQQIAVELRIAAARGDYDDVGRLTFDLVTLWESAVDKLQRIERHAETLGEAA